jgi:hypothetical protein
VAAGAFHNLGLKSDGSVIAWGRNDYGQCDVPAPNTGFVAVTVGDLHSAGLKADGSVVVWGSNQFSQRDVPEPNTGFVAIAAGSHHTLGIKGTTTAIMMSDVAVFGGRGYVEVRCRVTLDAPGKLRVLRAPEVEGPFEVVGHETVLAAGSADFYYRDTHVDPGTMYFYRVACRDSDEWVYSAPVRVLT